jgi:hypothetical protein
MLLTKVQHVVSTNIRTCLKDKILLTQSYPLSFPYKYSPFPYVFHAPFLPMHSLRTTFLEREREREREGEILRLLYLIEVSLGPKLVLILLLSCTYEL